MVGGAGPPGLVTPKVSVRHWVKAVTGMVPAGPTTPELATRFPTTAEEVLGPETTKLAKSRRNCQDTFGEMN